jgi:hypothetical protein
VHRTPHPVIEIEDLRGQEIEGQFYSEELVPIRITKRTTFKIDKILDKRVRPGILEYLVRWRGYSDSWVPATDIQSVYITKWIAIISTSRCIVTPLKKYTQTLKSAHSRYNWRSP